LEELGWLLVAISTLPLVTIAGRNVVLLNEAARTLQERLTGKT